MGIGVGAHVHGDGIHRAQLPARAAFLGLAKEGHQGTVAVDYGTAHVAGVAGALDQGIAVLGESEYGLEPAHPGELVEVIRPGNILQVDHQGLLAGVAAGEGNSAHGSRQADLFKEEVIQINPFVKIGYGCAACSPGKVGEVVALAANPVGGGSGHIFAVDERLDFTDGEILFLDGVPVFAHHFYGQRFILQLIIGCVAVGRVGHIIPHDHADGILDLVGSVGMVVIALAEDDAQRPAVVAQARVVAGVGGMLDIGIAVKAEGHQYGVARCQGHLVAAVKSAVSPVLGVLFVVAPAFVVLDIPDRQGGYVVVIGGLEMDRRILIDIRIQARMQQQVPQRDALVSIEVPVVFAVGEAVLLLQVQIGHGLQLGRGVVDLFAQAAAAQGKDILR